MSTGLHRRVGARRGLRVPAVLRLPAVHRSAVAQLCVVLTMVASVNCTGRNESNESPPGSDTAGDPLPLAEWIVGQWQIAAENGTGPQLTISIDSATATIVNGHVMRFISGNTGVGPAEFRPFAGNVRPDESIEFTIEMVDAQPSTRMQLELHRTTAELEVRGFRLGTQDMTANNRVWIVRRPR